MVVGAVVVGAPVVGALVVGGEPVVGELLLPPSLTMTYAADMTSAMPTITATQAHMYIQLFEDGFVGLTGLPTSSSI